MSLTKIRLANKRAKREARRKAHHAEFVRAKKALKIRNKRMRKMMVEGRRQDLQKRRAATAYAEQLETEVVNAKS